MQLKMANALYPYYVVFTEFVCFEENIANTGRRKTTSFACVHVACGGKSNEEETFYIIRCITI